MRPLAPVVVLLSAASLLAADVSLVSPPQQKASIGVTFDPPFNCSGAVRPLQCTTQVIGPGASFS